MNKKGFGFPSIVTIFVVILVVIVLAMAQNGFDNSTINSTIESFNWSKYSGNVSSSIQRAGVDSPYWVQTCLEIVDKGIDFMGYSIFAVGKLAMQLARDNPNIINYKVLFWLLILSLIAPLIYPIFMIVVSLILIIKEWYQNRKERRLLSFLEKTRRKHESLER